MDIPFENLISWDSGDCIEIIRRFQIGVGSASTVERVREVVAVPIVTGHGIISIFAEQNIMAGVAVDQVIVVAAVDEVIVLVALKQVVAGESMEGVVAAVAMQGVVCRAAADRIVPG